MSNRKNSNLNKLKAAVTKTEEKAVQTHLNGVQDLVNTYLSMPAGRQRDKAIRKIVYDSKELQNLLAENEEIITGKVEQALMQSATGYTYEEKEIRIINGKKSVKTTIKQVPPNQAAMEFYLTNKKPDEWQKNPTGTSEDKNGKVDEIMEALKNARKTEL